MNKLKNLIKILFVITPITWVLLGADFNAVSKTISSLPLWIFPLSFTILMIRAMFQSYRYQILISGFTDSVSVIDMILVDMKARYYSIIIPSSLGLDISRGALLKDKITGDQMVSSSLFFRITGVLPLFLSSIIGMIMLSSNPDFSRFIPSLIIISLTVFTVSISLFSKTISNFIVSILLTRFSNKIGKFLIKSVESFQLYRGVGTLKLNILNMIISIISQFLIVVNSLIVLKAVSGKLYIKEIFTFIPVTEILSLLVPIAPNGAGARETMYILLFNILHLPKEQMLLFIAISSTLYGVSLFGIFVIVYEKFIKRDKII